MSLSLACACGARFEVEESLARQTVACPECQRGVQAPAVTRRPLRTSGWAVAGVVTGLVMAFTGIGTILAILFGIVALISIARHRGEVVGTGYGVFSIVWGVVFTGLFALAVIKGEVFGVGEGMREGLMGKEVERSGPLEVRRPADNYAITRPTPKWYVAKAPLAERLVDDANALVLANLAKDSYLDVSVERLGWGRNLDGFSDELLQRYRPTVDFTGKKTQPGFSNLTVRSNQRLAPVGDLQRTELLLDVRLNGVWTTFLVRLIYDPDSNNVYIIRAWAQRRRFSDIDAEARRALDSFRLLTPAP